MMNKEQVMDWVETAPAKEVKHFALMVSNILSETQLKAIATRFTTKVEFNLNLNNKPAKKKSTAKKPEPVEEEMQMDADDFDLELPQ